MRRTRFDDAECPIARVTDLFGEWWTPLVLRDAMYGITKFEDFQHELGVSRAILTARLSRLVDEGYMDKVPYQDRPVRHEYVLTDKGRAMWDVLAVMWRFGEEHLWEDGEQPLVELAFRDTKERVRPVVVDEATGRPVDLAAIRIRSRTRTRR
ncbi:MAG: helix-turn-helix domain-containing protein [Acidimicrobiales bacterium]|nr:helix-turn-helix domain-containing protein [Acidimicrobiales bacterium]